MGTHRVSVILERDKAYILIPFVKMVILIFGMAKVLTFVVFYKESVQVVHSFFPFVVTVHLSSRARHGFLQKVFVSVNIE